MGTHGSLNELGNKKASEAEKTMNLFKGKNYEENKEAAKPKKDAANFFEMKRMMKELETLYSQYNEANFAYNKVPIYSINSNFTSQDILKGRNTFFPWWKPMCTLNQLIDLPKLNPVQLYNNSEVADANSIQNFVKLQKPIVDIMREWHEQNKKCNEMKKKEIMKKKDLRKAKTLKKSLKNRRESCPKKFVLR